MSKYITKNLGALKEYVPGEQPQDKKYVKLNTNESPYPASDGVINAINEQAIKNLRLYSDPEANNLKLELARVYKVNKENVFVSNGSDEILNFTFMAYGKNGVAFADVTYGFYPVFAELYGIEQSIIPLKKDFSLDDKAFYNLNKLIVIANPNAPTGMAVSTKKIEGILKSNKNSVVVIDEAYVDFGGESCTELTKKYDNLLVVQTFSKSRSMAGARLGFAIASEEIIKDLEKIKYSTNPYNVNSLTQIAGIKSLQDNDYYLENAKRIIKTRDWVVKELEKLGFKTLKSKANFIFATNKKVSGKTLYLKLKEKGVLIRHFDKERIKDFNRITVGSQEEMEIFIQKVKEILGEL